MFNIGQGVCFPSGKKCVLYRARSVFSMRQEVCYVLGTKCVLYRARSVFLVAIQTVYHSSAVDASVYMYLYM